MRLATLVVRGAGARDQLIEATGEDELAVDEHKDMPELRMDRDLGFFTFFEIGSEEAREIATDEFFLASRHEPDARWASLTEQ